MNCFIPTDTELAMTEKYINTLDVQLQQQQSGILREQLIKFSCAMRTVLIYARMMRDQPQRRTNFQMHENLCMN